MELENPVRLGGLTALLVGVLLVISELASLYFLYLYPIIFGHYFALGEWVVVDGYLGRLVSVLLQLGLVGLYARQVRAAGALGVVAFFMSFVGAWFAVGGSFISPFGRPSAFPPGGELEEFWEAMAGFTLVFVLGWALFGVATLRAGIYPRAAGALLIAGSLILILPLPLSGTFFAVAVAWLGYILFMERSEEASRSAGEVEFRQGQ